MKIILISFIIMFLNINFAYSYNLNDTFRVNKQSDGYRLGWNLNWAEKCNYLGYFNKFWKQGWSYSNRADESTGCSKNILDKLLVSTEKLLDNSKSKVTSLNSKNTKNLDVYSLCEKATISGKTFMWRRDDLFPEVKEAKKRGLSPKDCGVVIISKLSDAKICQFATKGYDIKIWDKDKFPIHVEVADKRGLDCAVNKEKQKTIKSNSPNNAISNKTKDAEDKCTEIGFKKGTEKYGECVLKMIELK